jgi:hypothetical protein
VLRAQLSNLLTNLVQKYSCVRTGFITDSRDDPVIKIAQRQDCFIRANINSKQAKPFSVETQRCGRFATNRSRAAGTFFNDARVF